MAPGEARTAVLEEALVNYRLATTISTGRDIFMARAMSSIAELYVDFPEIAPPLWEDELRVLLNEAAALGDAGGFLGLAQLALTGEDFELAYAFASRAAELGTPEQIEDAREILIKVCRPGAWDTTCASVPVFFVTTRKVDTASPTSFGSADSSRFEPSFGLAFTPVPILSNNYAPRQALYEAARDVVGQLLGPTELARLDNADGLVVFSIPDPAAWSAATAQVAATVPLRTN